MRRLDELQKAEDAAAKKIQDAARVWRISAGRAKSLWLKRLALAVDAFDEAQNAWMAEYDAQKEDERAAQLALLSFESEGGLLDLAAERKAELVADYMSRRGAWAPRATSENRSLQ